MFIINDLILLLLPSKTEMMNDKRQRERGSQVKLRKRKNYEMEKGEDSKGQRHLRRKAYVKGCT